MKPTRLILTCEHAGNEIPPHLREQLVIPPRVLASHRGYDRGSLEIAQRLTRECLAELLASQTSRLVIDLNRSERSPELFSRYAERLSQKLRDELLERYYRPFRAATRESIAPAIDDGDRVLHLSVHTFTPIRNGSKRTADVGLLYDPRRTSERTFAQKWRKAIERLDPSLRVRMNYPYLGTADGHTTDLRTVFP
ncbi:MAG: N-formylglutamate amidohydrolase, partial [Pirellulales bacterium]